MRAPSRLRHPHPLASCQLHAVIIPIARMPVQWEQNPEFIIAMTPLSTLYSSPISAGRKSTDIVT